MIVFIDESGDPGFQFDNCSSQFFLISLVIFETAEAAEQAEKVICALHNSLMSQREFKFSKSDPRIKQGFFEGIECCEFKIEAIVVDKKIISSEFLRERPKSFYNFILRQIMTRSRICNAKAKIILDGKGNKHFSDELKTYLRRDGGVKMKSFSLKDSKKDNLVQLADMVSGAIMCSYKREDLTYRNLLKSKIVNIWPFK